MPNGPADNSPYCKACGLAFSARGCSAERCANPEGAAELERLRAAEMIVRDCRFDVTDESLAIPIDGRAFVNPRPSRWEFARPETCPCDRCKADGPHDPWCSVHEHEAYGKERDCR